jgi:O-antigen/teichoic acid export membrane protein
MQNSNKVIKNTFILYFRLIISVAIGLFTTRLVLLALGEIDYGIYTLVGGVIGMLAFLQGIMTNASMRFIAHSEGSNDLIFIKKTFNTTLFLHILFGLILVIILEVGGIIMFKYYLNIPLTRINDAHLVFHFMVITAFVSVISVPYDAVINAHENMTMLSIVDIFGYLLKLINAIFISFIEKNQLIIYGLVLLIIQLLLRIIKQRYSVKKYPECTTNFRTFVDKTILKRILSFSSWTFISALSSIATGQLQNVILNIFFGVRLNSAYGIASTASGQVSNFSNSMTMAIRPQLIKSEGGGDRIKMMKITSLATKYSIFLFALFAIPVYLEMPYLLKLWLTNIPDYTIIFSRLILIGIFIDKFSFEIGAAIVAVGNIRNATFVESGIIFLGVLVSYYALKFGFPPYSYFIISNILGVFIFIVRLYFGKIIFGLNVIEFIKNSLLPNITPIVLSVLIASIPMYYFEDSFYRLLLTTILSIISLIVSFVIVGQTKYEFILFKSILINAFKHIFIKFHKE